LYRALEKSVVCCGRGRPQSAGGIVKMRPQAFVPGHSNRRLMSPAIFGIIHTYLKTQTNKRSKGTPMIQEDLRKRAGRPNAMQRHIRARAGA
jgi:hypothetical protein